MKYLFIHLALTFFLCSKITDTLSQESKINITNKYSIYIDPNSSKQVILSAKELQSYIEKSLGIQLKIVSQIAIPEGNFISLGATNASKTLKIDTEGLQHDGFKVLTKNHNVIIIGIDNFANSASGTLNGVYYFIENYLNVRWYAPYEYENILVSKNSSIAIKDTIINPLWGYRKLAYIGKSNEINQWSKRLLLGGPENLIFSHSWKRTIPASLFDTHPEWFAEVDGKPKKPHNERYKLETTNPELVKAFAEKIIQTFKDNPSMECYSLSPSDGSHEWSNSKATMALTEKDINGNLSRTPLVLKFYNDVAKIVAKEFPNKKLAGYIYASYLYPPQGGIPKIEPNIILNVAGSIGYGYKLFKEGNIEKWNKIISDWSSIAKKNNIDIYYYDLPNWIRRYDNNIIIPPAPDLINHIFSQLVKHNYKGIIIYGQEGEIAYFPSNYMLAKLLWQPTLDANKILDEYYRNFYGESAAPYIKSIYTLLENEYKTFYNKNDLGYNLTPQHLSEIYAPSIYKIEDLYLKAVKITHDEKFRKNLKTLEIVIAKMKGNLLSKKLIIENPNSTIKPILEQVATLKAIKEDD